MPSARPSPMSWISRSEKRFTGLLLRLATADELVVKLGVWQSAQPVLENSPLPLDIDTEPPGEVVDGVGGARNRMNIENFSMELNTSTPSVASGLVTLFGIDAN